MPTLSTLNYSLDSAQSELKDIKTVIELLKNTVNANNTQNAIITNKIKNSIT